ncbi:hypothetical protein QOT17_024345 [Balamuthia mandrillaris]
MNPAASQQASPPLSSSTAIAVLPPPPASSSSSAATSSSSSSSSRRRRQKTSGPSATTANNPASDEIVSQVEDVAMVVKEHACLLQLHTTQVRSIYARLEHLKKAAGLDHKGQLREHLVGSPATYRLCSTSSANPSSSSPATSSSHRDKGKECTPICSPSPKRHATRSKTEDRNRYNPTKTCRQVKLPPHLPTPPRWRQTCSTPSLLLATTRYPTRQYPQTSPFVSPSVRQKPTTPAVTRRTAKRDVPTQKEMEQTALNAHNNPATFTEKRLHRIRQRFLALKKLSTPSPTSTNRVIYALYSFKYNQSPIYVGWTSCTACTRVLQEISAAYSPNRVRNIALSRFIRRCRGSYISIIPLQQVPEDMEPLKAEHYWIHALQTQAQWRYDQKLNHHSHHANKHRRLCNKKKFNPPIHVHRHPPCHQPTVQPPSFFFFPSSPSSPSSSPSSSSSSSPPTLPPPSLLLLSVSVYAPGNSRQRSKQPSNLPKPQHHRDYFRQVYSLMKVKDSKLKDHLAHIRDRHIQGMLSAIIGKRLTTSGKALPPSVQVTQHHHRVCNTLTAERRKTLRDALLEHLDNSHAKPSSKKQPPRHPLPLEYCAMLFKRIGLHNIFHKAAQFLPEPLRWEGIKPVFYHGRSVGAALINAKKVVRDTTPNDIFSPAPCRCKEEHFASFTNCYSHVDTCDPKVVLALSRSSAASQLCSLIYKGSKHVERESPPVHVIIDRLHGDTERFITQKIEKLGLLPSNLYNWQQEVLRLAHERLTSHRQYTPVHQAVINSSSTQSLIKRMKDLWAISLTDKLSGNLSFVCKAHMRLRHFNYLFDTKLSLSAPFTTFPSSTNRDVFPIPATSPYTLLQEGEESIIKAHASFLRRYKISAPKGLATHYIIPKRHKDKPAERPITAALKTTTTPLCKYLHHFLRLLLDELKKKARLHKLHTGLNWFWSIETSTEVVQRLQEWNENPKEEAISVCAFDIDGFYNNIDQDDLIRALKEEVIRIAKRRRCSHILINLKGAQWTGNLRSKATISHGSHIFSVEQILELLQWQIKNCVVRYGNVVLKQDRGISQGVNHGPDLANFYTCHYECKFMLQLQKMEPHVAHIFSKSVQKIDDIALFNNPYVHQYQYTDGKSLGLYPKGILSLQLQNKPPFQSVDYLDTTIFITQPPPDYSGSKTRVWCAQTFNKTDKFSLPHFNYPQQDTDLPDHIIYGVFTSRLHSLAITNMRPQSFVG